VLQLPLVYPWFCVPNDTHSVGTEQVYPQDDNNQLLTWKPQKGARVHVTVGEAVDGSTILAEVNQSVVRVPEQATLWDHGETEPCALHPTEFQ
jgi:hypothetical protein